MPALTECSSGAGGEMAFKIASPSKDSTAPRVAISQIRTLSRRGWRRLLETSETETFDYRSPRARALVMT